MNQDNFLLTVALIAVLVSVVGMTITYNSISTFQNLLTGRAIEENGTVVVQIQTLTSVVITHADGSPGKQIDFGIGSVDTAGGHAGALLVTNGTLHGNNEFTTVNEGFRIQNQGNVRVNLSVRSNVSATDFFYDEGLPGTPRFEFNMSDYVNKSCTTWGSFSPNTYGNVLNQTNVLVCENFNFASMNDTLRMDLLLYIPADAPKTDDPQVAKIYLSYEEVTI